MIRPALAAAFGGLLLVPAALRAQEPAPTPFAFEKSMVFAQTVDRKLTRVACFGETGASLQMAFQYGTPAWQDSHRQLLGKARGKLLRLGSDFWTTLDTSMDLEFGAVKVPAGYYHVAAKLDDTGKKWSLVFLDAGVLRAKRLDAFLTGHLETKGIEVPMRFFEHDEVVAEKLTFGLGPLEGRKDRFQLSIRFGPYELIGTVVGHEPALASEASTSKSSRRTSRGRRSRRG